MLKPLVILALGLAALWLGRGYSKFLDNRLGQMSGVLALAEHIRDSLSRSLSFGGELYRDFSDEYLEKSGFLSLLREGKPPFEALSDPTVSLNLPESTRARLGELFSSFGKDYLDAEIRRLSSFIEATDNELRLAIDSLEKNKKVTSALIFGVWSSLAIILI